MAKWVDIGNYYLDIIIIYILILQLFRAKNNPSRTYLILVKDPNSKIFSALSIISTFLLYKES